MLCRKNQATLSTPEKARFVAAVLALKANGKYDTYVNDHFNFMSSAHRGPAFFPWHREFLRRFELDLQSVDSSVTLPYWNWTVDNSPTSSIWANDFMGGDGRPTDGQVMNGSFAYTTGQWTLSVNGPALRRRMGVGTATLPAPQDVVNGLAESIYDIAPYDDSNSLGGFRNTIEGWRNSPQLHNRVHVWVGGSMGPASSPNDPVFFLNHCFVDKLWVDWQAAHPGQAYLPAGVGPAGHGLNDAMDPWKGRGQTVTPASLLDHHVLGYAYDTEGICASVTSKWLDDIATLKFVDDRPTLKFSDDQTLRTLDLITLKFSDDNVTLKFVDDGPTLKFSDDGGPTLKFSDDGGPTLKFSDDGGGGTFKAVDDVKMQGFDIPLDPSGQAGRSVPFILSTPHHTMAWASTFPGSLQATLVGLESQLQQMNQVIQGLEQQNAAGTLDEASGQQLEKLRLEFQALLREHDSLSRAGQR